MKRIKCSRTKALQMTTAIAEESIGNLKNKLNNNKLYSLIINETTGISTKKLLVVLLRYYDNTVNEVKDSFLA